jgi:transmembrane sensor
LWDKGWMSEGNALPGEGRAAEEAAGWFARLQGEGVTADDWLAFERWLAAAPAHARAYEKLERLWVDLDQADIARELGRIPYAPAAAPAAPRRPAGPTRRMWLGAGAALAAGLTVAVLGADVWMGPVAKPQIYRTAPGETRVVELADGTRIRMNAASQISVSLGRDARRVQMADAEAVFDVTHDPKRPFLISVGDRQVRVVGTQFNLRHRDGRVALTVSRGVVEVRPAGSPDAQPTRVTVGEQLSHVIGQRVETLSTTEPEAAFAWTNGQLIYRDRPLSEVAGDLSRRFGTPVRLADAQTGALRFTGVLVTDSEPDVLRRLEVYAPVQVERVNGAVVLRRRS